VLTYLQLAALGFIVYWIILTNGPDTLRWALRTYVVGTVGAIVAGKATGVQVEEFGRYAATMGRSVDANMFGAFVGLAFLTAIYLLIVEKKLWWRLVLLMSILFLPVVFIKIGSRGTLVALAATFLLPFLFVREVARKPQIILLGMLVVVAGLIAVWFFESGRETGEVTANVEKRFTDPEEIQGALSYRIMLIKTAVETVFRYPAGTTYIAFFERTGLSHFPHNDLFYTLVIYGFPATTLLVVFYVFWINAVRQMNFSVHKFYARSILIFLLVVSLNIIQISQKGMWTFASIIFAMNLFYKDQQPQAEEISAAEEDYGYNDPLPEYPQ
jgi:hypothetical protein